MDSSSPDMVGRVIDGRYRLIRRLAQGGMADVYLAKESARKCRVAIKILRSLSPESQRRFAVEAEILSNIKSAGIVHALDFGKTSDGPNGRSYMALEYLEGASLSERLAQGPLPWRDVAEYGAQVADALSRGRNCRRGPPARGEERTGDPAGPGRARARGCGACRRIHRCRRGDGPRRASRHAAGRARAAATLAERRPPVGAGDHRACQSHGGSRDRATAA